MSRYSGILMVGDSYPVHAAPRGSYGIDLDTDTLQSLHVSLELLSAKVAAVLRRRIVAAQIPPGTRLVEGSLAAVMGVSRAPLREALGTLTREGLVDSSPGKGTYVKGLTEDRVRQLFAARVLLETHAVQLAAERVHDADCLLTVVNELVDRMAEAVKVHDIEEFADFDVRVHQVIWALSGNEFLADALGHVMTPCAVLIRLNAESFEDWPYVVELHRRLGAVVASGDGAVAASVVQEHLASALNKALSALRSQSGVFRLDVQCR